MKSIKRSLPLFAVLVFVFVSACDRAQETEGDVAPPKAPEVKAPTTPTTPTVPAQSVKHHDASAAADLLKKNSDVVILDIRTPDEFAEGHIQGALNIDFRGASFRDELDKLDRGKTYLVHCRSGGRSTQSLAVFEELGFTGIIHLDGGFNAWQAAGNGFVKD